MKVCGRCRIAYYCDEKCQRADWNGRAGHQVAWHLLFCKFVCEKDDRGFGELATRGLAFVIKNAAEILIDQINVIMHYFIEQHKGKGHAVFCVRYEFSTEELVNGTKFYQEASVWLQTATMLASIEPLKRLGNPIVGDEAAEYMQAHFKNPHLSVEAKLEKDTGHPPIDKKHPLYGDWRNAFTVPCLIEARPRGSEKPFEVERIVIDARSAFDANAPKPLPSRPAPRSASSENAKPEEQEAPTKASASDLAEPKKMLRGIRIPVQGAGSVTEPTDAYEFGSFAGLLGSEVGLECVELGSLLPGRELTLYYDASAEEKKAPYNETATLVCARPIRGDALLFDENADLSMNDLMSLMMLRVSMASAADKKASP